MRGVAFVGADEESDDDAVEATRENRSRRSCVLGRELGDKESSMWITLLATVMQVA